MESQLSITEAISLSGFETIDFIIGIVYLILLLSLSLFISRDREGREKDTKDYFLAGNTLTWWAVGASLIAANISAEQIIGMSGGGYANGLSIAAYEIMAAIALLLIGKYFLPIMFNSKIFTIPQFLRERYNDNVGLAFSIFWILLYIFINLTSVAWLGALAIEHILGLKGILISIGDFEVSIRLVIMAFLFLISAMYSLYGGFAAIAWSDVMQVTFIIGGSLITAYFALSAIAGSNGTFLDGFNKMYSYLTTGSHTKDVHFHLVVQESLDKSAFNNVPGLAAIVGGVWLTNLCYWGFNQYITQKGLAAKSLDASDKALIDTYFENLFHALNEKRRLEHREAYEELYDAPKESMSFSGADAIEKNSWENTWRLVENEAAEKSEATMPITEKTEPKLEENALTKEENHILRYLEAILSADIVAKKEALRLADLPEETLAEKINEIFFAIIDDIVLEICDGGPVLIEDYREEVSEWLKTQK
jgi:hypothetical protein